MSAKLDRLASTAEFTGPLTITVELRVKSWQKRRQIGDVSLTSFQLMSRSILEVGLPFSLNHSIPSQTKSSSTTYSPGAFGGSIGNLIVRLRPGCSAVRK